MPSPAQQYAYSDGVLHLSHSGSEMRLRWGPDSVAEIRHAQGKWQPFRPEFRILAPEGPVSGSKGENQESTGDGKKTAFEAFRAGIPPEGATAVERFRSHQWGLLALLGASEAARDLVSVNSVLAYGLGNSEHIRATPAHAALSHAVRHSHGRQRDILAWLGFPGTEAMVRVFKKVPPEVVYPGLLRRLRQASLVPAMLEQFGHLPRLNTGVIYLASLPEAARLVTPRLLTEVGADRDEETAAPTADLLGDMLRMTGKMLQTGALRPFTSCRKVHEWHRRVAGKYAEYQGIVAQQATIQAAMNKLATVPVITAVERNELTRLKMRYARLESQRPDQLPRPRPFNPPMPEAKPRPPIPATFPPPPVPGTKDIVPITSPRELIAEGNEQHNCIGRNPVYMDRIVEGTLYCYRVLAPERHSLAIQRWGKDCWQISELRRKQNALATPAAVAAVQAWLNRNQVSL